MEITEVSRHSEVSDKFREIIAKASAEYGVTVFDLAEEIAHKIAEMSSADAIKAANWYFDAHNYAQDLANEFHTTIAVTSAVISAVSPRMAWVRNKRIARIILADSGKYASLSALDAASGLALGLRANVAMAVKIARGANIDETLTGIKRRSFYNNIVAPATSDSVTVDTWMQMAYCNVTGKDKATALDFIRANEKALSGTGVGYFMIADAVRIVASDMELLPHQVQALYWVAVSGDYNGGRTDIA